MTKKILVFLLLLAGSPLIGFADTVIEDDNGLYYTISDDGQATVARQSTYGFTPVGEIIIPEMVGDNYPVVEIAAYAFYDDTQITSVVLPSSLTSIGNYAFYGCEKLESVDFSAVTKLTSIPNYCFGKCFALGEIDIPEGVTSIGIQAFAGEQFTGTMALAIIKLPSTLTSIGNNSFQYCNAITMVYCYAVTPPSLYYSFSEGLDATLCVPDRSVSAYTDSDWVQYFTDITSNCNGGNGGTEYEVTFNPAPGQITELTYIDITCTDGISVSSGFGTVSDSVVIYNGIIVTNTDTGEQVVASNYLYTTNETTCRIAFGATVSANGNYNVYIPAGVFLLGDSIASPEYNLPYTIGGAEEPGNDYTVVITPLSPVSTEHEGEYQYIYQFTLTCASGFERERPASLITLTDASGNTVATGYACEADEDENTYVDGWPTIYTLTLNEAVETEGCYTLTIPEGEFSFWTGSYDTTYTNVVPYTLEVCCDGTGQPSEETTEYLHLVVYPNGETTGPVTFITITTDNTHGLLLTNSDLSGITLRNNATEDTYSCTGEPVITDLEDGHGYVASYSLTLDKPINTTGAYTITIPAGYFESLNDNSDYIENNDTTVVFRLQASNVTFTFVPASGETLTELSVIEITSSTEYIELSGNGVATIVDASGTEYGIDTAVENDVCTITLTETVPAGTYTLLIPSGYFYVDANHTQTNGALEAIYVVRGFEFAPADGAVVNGSLDEIVITSNVKFVLTGTGEITVTNGTVTGVTCSDEADATGNYTCTITLTGTHEGSLTITIPAGYFTEQPNALTASYTIAAATTGPVFTFDPANGGGTDSSLSQFDITANCWLDVAATDLSTLTVTDAEGTVAYCTRYYIDEQSNESSTITIYLSARVSTLGTYTINVPAGFFYINEANTITYDKEITSEFNIVAFTFNPADGDDVSSLGNIIISCGGAYFGIENDYEPSEIILYLFGRTLEEVTYCESIIGIGNQDENGWYTSYILILAKTISDEGTYILLVPEGFFTYQSDDLEPAWFVTGESAGTHAATFDSTTGITGVDVDTTGDMEIYNLAGQKVTTPVRGTVNIIRNADGTVRKVFVK